MRRKLVHRKQTNRIKAFIATMILIYFYYHPNNAVIVGIMVLALYLVKFIRRRPKLSKCKNVQELLKRYHEHPTDFETYCALLFKDLGYTKITQTPRTGDGGRDLIMWKDNKKYDVEIKLYNANNKIGRPLIQKLHSAAITDKAKPVFLTTSTFTNEARQYAMEIGCELIDGPKLEKMIKSIK